MNPMQAMTAKEFVATVRRARYYVELASKLGWREDMPDLALPRKEPKKRRKPIAYLPERWKKMQEEAGQ